MSSGLDATEMDQHETLRNHPLTTLVYPFARFSPTYNVISPKLAAELRPPDPIISDNDKDDSPPTLDEDRMPPKIYKQWI